MAELFDDILQRLNKRKEMTPAELLGYTPFKDRIAGQIPGAGTFQASPRLVKETTDQAGYPMMLGIPEDVQKYEQEINPELKRRRAELEGRKGMLQEFVGPKVEREKLYEDTIQQLLQGGKKYTPSMDYRGALSKLQEESAAIKEPEESTAAQVILSLAPALASLTGESAALAAPRSYQAAQETYQTSVDNVKKANENRRKAITAKIEALSKAQANDVIQFSEEQKTELERLKSALTVLDKQTGQNTAYYEKEKSAIDSMERSLDSDVMESAKAKLGMNVKQSEAELNLDRDKAKAEAQKELQDRRLEWDKEKADLQMQLKNSELELKKAIEERNRAKTESDIKMTDAKIDSLSKNFDLATKKFEDAQNNFKNEYGLKFEKFMNDINQRDKDRDSREKLAEADRLSREARAQSEEALKKSLAEAGQKHQKELEDLRAQHALELQGLKNKGAVEIKKVAPPIKAGKGQPAAAAPQEGEIVPGYIWNGKTQISKSDIPKLQSAKSDRDTIIDLIKTAKTKIKNASNFDLSSPYSSARKEIDGYISDAQLLYKGKNFAELGVLTGPDTTYLDAVLEPPGIKSLISGGKEEALKRYDNAINRIESKLNNTMSSRGLSKVQKATGGGGLSREEMIKNLRAKGKYQ